MKKGYTPRKCIECGRVFEGWGDLQVRCPECQREHRREIDRERAKRRYVRPEVPHTKSMVINGHVQVCRNLHRCFYGQDQEIGCSYALEEKKTRTGQGFYIVDGKCPAYREKKKGEHLKRKQLFISVD